MARAPKKVENTGVAKNEEKYTHQPKSNSLKIKLDDLRTFDALTPNQQKFFDIYKRGGYLIGMWGSPGVGKSFLSLLIALEEVMSKDNSFEQVVVVRSVVPSRDVGFLPGTLEEKAEVYELPYKEICATLFGRKDAWDRLKEQGHCRFLTTTAIRGISIDDSIIIVDESQNYNFGELATVISRTGHRSKIIFCGDMFQNDLVRNKNDQSGLGLFLSVLRSMKEYEEVMFTPDDIVRSSLVKSFLLACAEKGLLPNN